MRRLRVVALQRNVPDVLLDRCLEWTGLQRDRGWWWLDGVWPLQLCAGRVTAASPRMRVQFETRVGTRAWAAGMGDG